jgi:hypothetical protein
MDKSESPPPTGHYNANYGNFQTELYAQIRHEAFGEDIGQNSWLTSDEQNRFIEWLDLSPGEDPARRRLRSRRSGVANRRYHWLFCRRS